MLVRIVSAFVALPIALVLIHLGGWAFMGLMVAVTGICLWELGTMLLGGDAVLRAAVLVLGELALVGAVTGVLLGPLGAALVGLAFVALLFLLLFRVGAIETAAARLGGATLALAWGALLPITITLLRQLPEGEGWVLMACVLAWGSDTGAYFAGRFLGKRKLYPLVSPNKTWAGAVGGVIVATGMAYGFSITIGPHALSVGHLAVIAPIGAALGQLGDLAESLLKRAVGVKDSGTIMPGHGGLLDRIDALVVTAPVLLAYAIGVLGLALTPLGFAAAGAAP